MNDSSPGGEFPKRRPHRATIQKFGRLLLAISGLVVGVITAEMLLRLAGVAYPLPYTPDPFCGSRLHPEFSAWFTEEGRAFVVINRDGNRDVDHQIPKPANTLRIAVLGDSYAEAVQVPIEQTFWSVLERELQNCQSIKHRRIEVLNFGVSGFSTAQELQILRSYVWKYEPDIILLAFVSGNDVRDNSKSLSGSATRPYFQLGANDELTLDDSFLQSADYLKAQSLFTRFKVWLINRSRILQVVAEYRTNRRAAASNAPSTRQGSTDGRQMSVTGELGLDDAVYIEPSAPEWQSAWRVTEKLIETMHVETIQKGAAFWLVAVTNGIQVHPDEHCRESYQQRLGVPDLYFPERRLEALAKRLGFRTILLAPRMRPLAVEKRLYLHGFDNTELGEGHWNSTGHRLAGEIIAAELCAEQLF